MRSAGTRSVPLWVAVPIVLLLGAGGYAVISYVANDRPDVITGDPGFPTEHGESSDHESSDHESSDHGDGHGGTAATAGHDHGDTAAGHAEGADQAPAVDRPRGLVLGGFAAINGAVLVSAAVLRHRGGDRRRSRGGSTGARRP